VRRCFVRCLCAALFISRLVQVFVQFKLSC